jgi:hypothetical protein
LQKQPVFNIEGQTLARYCADHKTGGMINVKSKRCEHPDCKKQPTYNIEGQTIARYCADHKTDGMISCGDYVGSSAVG